MWGGGGGLEKDVTLKVTFNYILFIAVKLLGVINHIQNKSLHNMYVYCVYVLCIYKYTHMHVYISDFFLYIF